jgi:uncharacterized secreted protein with C-terminal beta-propeller domain
MMTTSRLRSLVMSLVGAMLLVAGCQGPGVTPAAPAPGDWRFASAPPNAYGSYGGYSEGDRAGATGAPNGQTATAPPSQGAPREIEEADIIKVDGNTLYALNGYRGLYVIDITNPDQPTIRGHHEMFGYPIEMYVRDDRVYVVLSNYFQVYGWGEGDGSEVGSAVIAVDVADPTAPLPVSRFHVPGYVTDTRIVGDVLYAVADRYSWFCYYGSCGDPNEWQDTTNVTSINIADPADIRQVDSLTFVRDAGWETHVHVNTRAIYIANSAYTDTGYVANIRYVDITSPTGQLVLGTTIQVPGYIQDRWQMDEYQGVFRVVTPWDSWSNSAPRVYTFRVDSPQQIVPLAELAVQLPRPETMTASRFSGTRLYVVTYERVDPLFVIDLTDPVHPVQAGQLEMPGWLDHIVPRGDRLVAFGHDDTGGETNLAVSLFDVSDAMVPTLLARVSAGNGWGWITDERDNYDKVFKVLDDQGLILLPLMSCGDGQGTYWRCLGGVQLVDFTTDTLTQRGYVQHEGYIRRAFMANERLMTLSDERLQVLNIADRDQPVKTADLALARNVTQFSVVGEYGVQLVGDWYAGTTTVVIVPLAQPDLGTPVGQVAIDAPYARLFTQGEHLFVLHRDPSTWGLKLQSIDLSNAAAPTLRGELELPAIFDYYGYYYGWWWWGYSGYPRMDEVVQVSGSTLVLHAVRSWYYYGDCAGCDPDQVLVVDLAQPDVPVIASTLDLVDRDWVAGLIVSGDEVLFTHYNYVQGGGGNEQPVVQYFLNRLDVSDPYNPVLSTPVNVPGVVLATDAERGLVYTEDYQWGSTDWSLTRSLNTLALTPNGQAVLLGRVDVPTEAGMLTIAGERAWFTKNVGWWDETDSRYYQTASLQTIDLQDPAAPTLETEAVLPVPYASLALVQGNRAVIGTWWYLTGLMVYDVTEPTAPELLRQLQTQGWMSDLTVHDGQLYLATGPYGVKTVSLE